MEGDVEKFEILLKNKAEWIQDVIGFTPLHTAVFENCASVVEYIAENFNPAKYPSELMEIEDTIGETALLLAARIGYSQSLNILLKYKAKLNATDNEGNTALHLATYYNHYDAVDILLRHIHLNDKLDIASLKNTGGEVARDLALKLENKEILKLFEKYMVK